MTPRHDHRLEFLQNEIHSKIEKANETFLLFDFFV